MDYFYCPPEKGHSVHEGQQLGVLLPGSAVGQIMNHGHNSESSS